MDEISINNLLINLHCRSRYFPTAQAAFHADHELFKVAHELFIRLPGPPRRVRLIGIRFTHLIPETYQINIFEDREEMVRLYQSIDHIKARFGEGLLVRGRPLFPNRNK